jgi:hypothetical protein
MSALSKWLVEIDTEARIVDVKSSVDLFYDLDYGYPEGNPECHICDLEFDVEHRVAEEPPGFLTAPTSGYVIYQCAKITFEAPDYDRQPFGSPEGGPCCPDCLADAHKLLVSVKTEVV